MVQPSSLMLPCYQSGAYPNQQPGISVGESIRGCTAHCVPSISLVVQINCIMRNGWHEGNTTGHDVGNTQQHCSIGKAEMNAAVEIQHAQGPQYTRLH